MFMFESVHNVGDLVHMTIAGEIIAAEVEAVTFTCDQVIYQVVWIGNSGLHRAQVEANKLKIIGD